MASKVNQKIKSQIERANEILLGLHSEVTAADRDAALKELEFSKPTLVRYLNGKAKDIQTALELIKFLKGRIGEREKQLAA